MENCIGCELCVLETQRQLKKVGLEGAPIRIFRKRKEKSEYLEFGIEIDPRISSLDIEKVKNICPRAVFELVEDNGETSGFNS